MKSSTIGRTGVTLLINEAVIYDGRTILRHSKTFAVSSYEPLDEFYGMSAVRWYDIQEINTHRNNVSTTYPSHEQDVEGQAWCRH